MRPLFAANAAALVTCALAGCAPDPVVVELAFPTESAFVQSRQGRVIVFPLAEDELGICPELLHQLEASRFPIEPVFDSEPVDVCELRAALRLPELAQGPHAYLVEVRNESAIILQGCAIGEVFTGAGTIRVDLHPTDVFVPTSSEMTAEAKCSE